MTELRDHTVLVTGAGGFIGSHLVARLSASGARVCAVVRPGGDVGRLRLPLPNVRLLHADVTDAAGLRSSFDASRPTLVVHLAGLTSARAGNGDWEAIDRALDVNLRGTLAVLRAACGIASTVRRVVRIGGLEEYGRGPLPFDEAQRERPVSPYSASQVAATHFCQMLQSSVPFDIVTVRPALVYGPEQGSTFFIPALIEGLLRGEDFEMTSGEQTRDLLYVDDVVSALLQALDTEGLAGAILNVGSGQEYVMRDVALCVERLVGSPGRVRVGARPARAVDVERLRGRIDRARELLGWAPTIGLDEGLRRTVEWFRSRDVCGDDDKRLGRQGR